jgi:hypothetical protein
MSIIKTKKTPKKDLIKMSPINDKDTSAEEIAVANWNTKSTCSSWRRCIRSL